MIVRAGASIRVVMKGGTSFWKRARKAVTFTADDVICVKPNTTVVRAAERFTWVQHIEVHNAQISTK